MVQITDVRDYFDKPQAAERRGLARVARSIVCGSKRWLFLMGCIVFLATPLKAQLDTIQLGTSNLYSSNSSITPQSTDRADARRQILIRASELNPNGATNIVIKGLAMNFNNVSSQNTNVRVYIKTTSSTTLFSSYFLTEGTQVYNGLFPEQVGWNWYNFSSNFNWNGTSNLLITYCYSNVSTSSGASSVQYGSAGFTCHGYRASSEPFQSGCDFTSPSATSNKRPNFRFRYQADSEMKVVGSGNEIADNDTTASTANGTDFGQQMIGVGSTHTFDIENDEFGSLDITTPIVITGTHSGDFQVISQPQNRVSPYGSTSFSIQFNPSALGARKATVTITNDDPNEGTYSFTIEGEGTCGMLSTSTIVNSNTYCTTMVGAATAMGLGSTGPFTYAWSSGSNTASISSLGVGVYYVTVTDSMGCTGLDSASIGVDNNLNASIAQDSSVSCSGGHDAGLTASATGNTGSVSYLWSNASSSASIDGLSSGTYTATITDSLGCVDTSSFLIDTFTQQPQVYWVSIGSPFLYRADINTSTGALENVQLLVNLDLDNTGGSNNYSLDIDHKNGKIYVQLIQNGHEIYRCNLDGSNVEVYEQVFFGFYRYTLHVDDVNGYLFYGNWNNDSIGRLDIVPNASSNKNHTWIDGLTHTKRVMDIAYDYVLSDLYWLERSPDTAIGNVLMKAHLDPGSTAATGEQIVADFGANFGRNMSFDRVNRTLSTLLNDGRVHSYQLDTGADTTYANLFSGSGDHLALVGGESLGFLYSGVGYGDIARRDYPLDTSGSAAIAYDDNIQIRGLALYGGPEALSIALNATENACAGDLNGDVEVTILNGTASYGYAWSNGSLTASTTQTSDSIAGLAAGQYTVTVSDARGCAETATVTLSDPELVQLSIATTDAICLDDTNGSAIVTGTGGTPDYTFLWSNGGSADSLSGLGAGTYTVTISDANACSDTASATISSTVIVQASIAQDSAISCAGGMDAGLTASATGGNGSLSFLWSNASSTASIDQLIAATYFVTVTDSLGCKDSAFATLADPDQIQFSSVITPVECTGDANGMIDLVVSGGTGGYTYSWSNGSSQEDLTSLVAGSYTVTVTDTNGCTASLIEAVTEAALLLSLSTAATDASCNGTSDGEINLSITGGESPFTYQWSISATTEDISGLNAGSYNVTVTDTNGCIKTTSDNVAEPAMLNPGNVLTN